MSHIFTKFIKYYTVFLILSPNTTNNTYFVLVGKFIKYYTGFLNDFFDTNKY